MVIQLPLVSTTSQGSDTGSAGCGSCSTSSARDEEKARLRRGLADEMRAALVGIRQAAPTSDAVDRARRHTSAQRTAREAGGGADRVTLDHRAPLPLHDELSHRVVGERHLWIGVLEGVVISLPERDSRRVERLAAGETPAAVAADDEGGWRALQSLIGRLAASGLIKGIAGHHEVRLPAPHRFARFHLTKACQLECVHCYAESGPAVDRHRELSTERWIALAEDFAAQGGERVLFTGGEALMHRGAIDIMRRCHELGLFVTLFSNGLMIPRNVSAVAEICDEVQISLDGPTAESNDPIRGRGTYRKIIKAIDALLDAGVPVRAGMSVMEKNWEEWRAGFHAFAERYASTALEFRLGFGLTHYGRAADMDDDLEIGETQPEVEKMLETLKGNFDGQRVTRKTNGCGYAEQLVVGPDGTIYPCHLLDAPIGHIDDRPLEDTMRLLFATAEAFDVDHTEGCRHCDIRHLCGGTCRVLNGEANGSRLRNTCTPADKNRRLRNLADIYYKEEVLT